MADWSNCSQRNKVVRSIVFCPHCGRSDQQQDAYCKGCGQYLYTHSLFPTDAPADIAAWLTVFSAITVIVCLIGLVYPASKLSSNPAFPSIILLQLFSMLVAYKLRRRLRRKRAEAAGIQEDRQKNMQTNADRLLPPNPATVTEKTTNLLDALPTESERK